MPNELNLSVSYIPWWFKFISWAIPSIFSKDGNIIIEAKMFRGELYIVSVKKGVV